MAAINDAPEWIQSFPNYHCPQAVRIIDRTHGLDHVAVAGKAIWGEGSDAFGAWFSGTAHRLKHRPPRETVANLRLLQQKAKTDQQTAEVERALFYIERRLGVMDYPHFQSLGYPIGSGAVESGHKVVTHRRLKGPGMRWGEEHVDPMLALRDLLCNDRWDEGWQQVVAYQKQRQLARCLQQAQDDRPPPTPPITFASLAAAGLLPIEEPPVESEPPTCKRWHPPADFPWRNDNWCACRSSRGN